MDRFQQHHSQQISYAVGLPWLVEAVGLWIWLITDPGTPGIAFVISSLGALLSLILTIVGAAPAHRQLSSQYVEGVSKRLIRIHWIRTGPWAVSAAPATVGLLQLLS